MANPTWPISLPRPQVEGISYGTEPNVIRTQMDAGAAKVRRRFTAVPETLTFALVLTPAQVQVLDDFAIVTLADVLPFDWMEFRRPNDPETLVTYRFKSRPKYRPRSVAGRRWVADIELELLTTFQGTFLLDVAPLST